jgi:hypothetical protein
MESSAMPVVDGPTELDVAIANFALNVSPAHSHSMQACKSAHSHFVKSFERLSDSVLFSCCLLMTAGVPGGRVLLIRRY